MRVNVQEARGFTSMRSMLHGRCLCPDKCELRRTSPTGFCTRGARPASNAWRLLSLSWSHSQKKKQKEKEEDLEARSKTRKQKAKCNPGQFSPGSSFPTRRHHRPYHHTNHLSPTLHWHPCFRGLKIVEDFSRLNRDQCFQKNKKNKKKNPESLQKNLQEKMV